LTTKGNNEKRINVQAQLFICNVKEGKFRFYTNTIQMIFEKKKKQKSSKWFLNKKIKKKQKSR